MRATHALIHSERFRDNLSYVLRCLNKEQVVCVAVKANAYGHGLVTISRIVQTHPESSRLRLGVATVHEGVILREAHISLPIWVFSYVDTSELSALYQYRLEPFVGDFDYCQALISACPTKQRTDAPLPLHLKIDSGMGRIGCSADMLVPIYRAICNSPHVSAASLCTHLADAYDSDYTAQQYQYFEQARSILVDAHAEAERLPLHAANSAAILNGDGRRYSIVRPGIMLYGYDPDPSGSHSLSLKPVMELRSKIVALKSVQKGTAISYSMTWRAPKDTQIATIPIGYGDGYTRRLSGMATNVLIRTRPAQYEEAPIVGLICMDQLMVDVGHLHAVSRGQTVVLFGDSERRIGADRLARQTHTNTYEITTAIQERVPRCYT